MTQIILAICSTLIQKLNKIKLLKAKSWDELVAVDDFRQEIYLQQIGIEKIPQTNELVQPTGMVSCYYLEKNKKIVGTVSLFDPSIIKPYTAYFFSDSELSYNPKQTYELCRIALDISHQRSDNLFFLLLLLVCYRETRAKGRNRWLVCTHKRILNLTHRMGGKTRILASKAKISDEDCFQAQYWKNNQLGDEFLKDYRAYLIKCNRHTVIKIIKRYLKKII